LKTRYKPSEQIKRDTGHVYGTRDNTQEVLRVIKKPLYEYAGEISYT
jgi:hypothetical protein